MSNAYNQSWDNLVVDSSDDDDHGLEMRASRARISPSTFGLSTRKARRSPPSMPFRTAETESSMSSSSSSSTFSSASSSPESSHRCCSQRDYPSEHIIVVQNKPGGRYDDPEPSWVEPLSPRPSRKRNSVGSSRPGLGSNTKTSFTADGDRVEEFNGKGSLRIGTHWVDEGTVETPTGLGTRGGRREWDSVST